MEESLVYVVSDQKNLNTRSLPCQAMQSVAPYHWSDYHGSPVADRACHDPGGNAALPIDGLTFFDVIVSL